MDGENLIIIDNTNTTRWEIEFYINWALDYGYQIYLLEPDTTWKNNPDELFKRNQHGTPMDIIKRMINRYQSNEEIYLKIKQKIKNNTIKENITRINTLTTKEILSEIGVEL